jgi:hypothetical protein
VVKGHNRFDTDLQQGVDQGPVEVEPAPAGLHARPGHREPVGADSQFGEQGDVLGPLPPVVGGHPPVVAVVHIARLRTEGVPDRGHPTVQVHATLDLVRRRRYAPEEALREPHVLEGWRARRRSDRWSATPMAVKGKIGAGSRASDDAMWTSTYV